jgi:hypothetical protein
MKYTKLFDNFDKKNIPNSILILDGTSSSGKSYISKPLVKNGWCVISVDSFYNVLFPDSFATEKYNDGSTITDIYGKIWHTTNDEHALYNNVHNEDPFSDSSAIRYPKNMFDSVQYYMMKEIKECKIWENSYLDDDGNRVGRNPKCVDVVIDDIEPGCALYSKYFELPECDIVLLYAPLDDLKRNLISRSKYDMRGANVFLEDFVERYELSENRKDTIDDKSWSKQEIIDLLDDDELHKSLFEGKFNIDKFLELMNLEDDVTYWVKLKSEIEKEFDYKKIINTRNKTAKEIYEEVLSVL